MNRDLLHNDIQEFILNNLESDVHDLVLKSKEFQGIPMPVIAGQIESKKRIQKKLPTWFKTTGIYYPNKKRLEQSSSELTANYKSKVFSGQSLIDLTGGFGIDAYFFSKVFRSVTYCETDAELSTIAAHNFSVLGAENIEVIHGSGISILNSSDRKFDCIYIDPSRRHSIKGRVHFIKECEPDITEYLNLFFNRSSQILIKLSPMLDLQQAVQELDDVSRIHILAINNEVKELLFELRKGFNDDMEIKTTNFTKTGHQTFSFVFTEEQQIEPNLGSLKSYLYEPNAAILKSGAFKSVGLNYGLDKLHQHTHLYTSDKRISFPGRVFNIEMVIPYADKKELKKHLLKTKGNLSVRNFPINVEALRRKFKIKDGGKRYIFFVTDQHDQKIVIIGGKA
ncbi:MAG: class I SAM-dependent methyltransferase [Flavobacteriaceae bacterium]|nr:class I SAM-dependent methyltransferase [Flavobacteriaceae bacterium]